MNYKTHVHHIDTSGVQFLDSLFGWHSNSTDKELGLFLNDDINEIIKLAFGIIIVGFTG